MFNAYATNTLQFNQALCNNCIMCTAVCPHAVFERSNGVVRLVHPENCMECGACQLNCPTGAVTVDSGVGCASLMIYQALTGKKDAECGSTRRPVGSKGVVRNTINQGSITGKRCTRMTSINRFSAYVMVALSSAVGGGSLLLFLLFLFLNSLHLVKLGLNESAILWLNTGLCLLFFAQHSGMIRRAFRRWWARLASPNYHGAVYSVASGVVLLLLVVLWQESPRMLLDFQGPLRWLMRGIYFLAIAGLAWGIQALDSFDTFGLAPILARVRDTQPKPIPFTVRGPYRWIRHPLYFSMLLLIWSSPDLTADRLLFNVLFTTWIIVGTMLEEIDLVNDFGEVYRDYQRNVPMLIPYRFRPFEITETEHKVTACANSSKEV